MSMSDDQIEQAMVKIAEARYPVSFSGAGLSAESGIATFRDKDPDALWSKFDPAALASQRGFAADPVTVIDWYGARRKTLSQSMPNAAHKALASQQGWVHITQNVDNLLEASGANDKEVLHLHGSLLQDHCNAGCGYREEVNLDNPPSLRNCPDCDSYLRPSVVWFGESLSHEVLTHAADSAARADLLLVVGTSAQVYPASGLIDIARDNHADIIVVNTEPSELASRDIELIGKAGEILPRLFSC